MATGDRQARRRLAARNARAGGVLAVALALGAAAAPARAEGCAPWPGEPSPLPNAESADTIGAYWARLRAEELARAARAQEAAGDVLGARAAWRHAGCLEPGRQDVRAGLERTRFVRVARPRALTTATAQPVAREATLAAALEGLDAPIWIHVPTPVATRAPQRADSAATESAAPAAESARAPEVAAAPAPALSAAFERDLDTAQALVRAARFDEALASLAVLRDRMDRAVPEPGSAARRTRLEVMAATAAVALGRDDEARRSFERALAVDPELRLDPATTSPKVLRALEAARGGAR